MKKIKIIAVLGLSCLIAGPAPAQTRAILPLLKGPAAARVPVPLTILAAPASLPPTLNPVVLSVSPAAIELPAAAPEPAAPSAEAPAIESPLTEALQGAQAPGTPESSSSSLETFWSGSSRRRASAEERPVSAVRNVPAAGGWSGRLAAAATLPSSHALAASLPNASDLKALLTQASPFLEAGAVLVGTYAANRLARWIIGKVAEKKGLDRHQIAAARLAVGVALWSAAAAGALSLGGAPQEAFTAVFGAGGTLLTLALKDVLGNLIHGVNFLITRPYTVGDRVQIDDSVGTVADLTLNGIRVAEEDGGQIKVRYATLAVKPVIRLGDYKFPDAGRLLASVKNPRAGGVAKAVWDSLDKGLILPALLLGGLLALPSMIGALATGWVAGLVTYALAGTAAWLTRRVELFAVKVVEALADRNAWRLESRVIARLAVRAAVWAVGGSAVLRILGVSWTALVASLGLTTLGVGLASNNFFSTVVQGAEVLFSKPFKVGDRLRVPLLNLEGTVEDMTLYHVIVKLDEGRHALLPYAVVRDAAIVVHPGKTDK